MDENKSSRYLTTLNSTMARIGNPVLHVLKTESRAQCSERARDLRKKPQWSVSDALRLAFYAVEENADPNRQQEMVEQIAAMANACLMKMLNADTNHMLRLFGIKEGSPEAEAIKAKEFASTLLQETQRSLEDMEARLKAALAEKDEAAHQHQQYAESIGAEKEAMEAELLASRQEVEKLRTELQTALIPQTVQAFNGAVEEAVVAKELAGARALIEQQQKLIEKYRASISAKFDDEFMKVLDKLAIIFDDPDKTLETKLCIYYLQNSVLAQD